MILEDVGAIKSLALQWCFLALEWALFDIFIYYG